MNVGDKILAVIDSAITPAPPPTFETLAATIRDLSGKPLVSKAENAELRDFQKKHDACAACVENHLPERAKADWLEHQSATRKAIHTPGSVSKFEGWSRHDFETDYAEKIQLAKLEQVEIGQASRPLCARIAQRFQAICDQLAADIEAREVEDYAKFGLPHQASPLVSKLRETGALAARRAGGNSSPRQQLPYVQL